MKPRPDVADHTARILIVDDDRQNRQVLEVMLASEGFVLQAAAGGEEALGMVALQPPDLILLDIMLPGMDGYEVAARIKGDPATGNIPIIMITALDDRNARILGLSAGAEEFLSKPIDRAELCVRVRNLLRLKAYGDYCTKHSQELEAEVISRTADLITRTATLEEQAAVLTAQAALLDLAQDAIILRDMQSRVLFWSRGAEVMYGWLSREAIGRVSYELLRTEFGEPVDTIEATLLREGLWEGEAIQHTRAGTRVIVAGRWTLRRDAGGTPVQILTINTDITERKQADAQLRTAKDAAETANRAKSEFLANMSHEIRTPMNGVIGMTDLVLDTELTSEQRENLLIVKNSADALLTVINDILDFSRMEAGRFELDPIDFSPRDAIGDAGNAMALRAHQKGLELIVDIGAAVPHTVRGDPGRLRQILINLLGNAIKFTQQGEVVLRVATEAATRHGDVVLRFSISDTGVGIPLNRQPHIFEAFTQADGSVTRTHGGTGLGLTISSQLVQLMGGRLRVESEVGVGSTFHFTASFASANASPAMTVGPDGLNLRDLHVLIVDDNATSRRLLEEMVIGWGMVPMLAAKASEALAALDVAQQSGRPFPLVLTDSQILGTDGFTLAAAIKQDPAIAGATVVMLTSAGQPGDAARCRELGIAAYLPKPIKRSELRNAIVSALGGQCTEMKRPPLVTRHSLREARHTGRILLVEDNVVNQLVARRLLEKGGHTVVVANTGREALAILEGAAFTGFTCVLMDVQMPEMDGFECTAIIRGKEQLTGVRLPIIAMTAHAMKGDEARCLAAGMDAYLSKPVQPDALFSVIERYLGISSGRVARSPARTASSDSSRVGAHGSGSQQAKSQEQRSHGHLEMFLPKSKLTS